MRKKVISWILLILSGLGAVLVSKFMVKTANSKIIYISLVVLFMVLGVYLIMLHYGSDIKEVDDNGESKSKEKEEVEELPQDEAIDK